MAQSTLLTRSTVLAKTAKLGLASAPTWTFLQDFQNTFCVGGSSTCTFTGTTQGFVPTIAGSVWVAYAFSGGGPNSMGHITSVTGGGGTWNLIPSQKCYAVQAAFLASDCAYNVSGSAGTNIITVTVSAPPSNTWVIGFAEFLPPPGSVVSLDDAEQNSSASCTTCVGPTLSLSATDAVFSVGISWNGSTATGLQAFNTPYLTDEGMNAVALNMSSFTAPSFSQSSAGQMVYSSIAFRSTARVFTPPSTIFTAVALTQNPSATFNCTPVCPAMTIPSTGSGHLLFLQSANLTASSYISSVSGGGTWVVPAGCQINLSGVGPLSCAYVLSSSSGATSVTVTMSSSSVNGFVLYEVSRSSGSFVLDAIGTSQRTASFLPLGQGLTLSGTDDVIFQGIMDGGGAWPSSPNRYPYYWSNNAYGNNFLAENASSAMLMDTANGTAPTWYNPQNSVTAVHAVAFK